MKTASKFLSLAALLLPILVDGAPVTFQVNMNYQITQGWFTPGNQVSVRGTFNNWASLDLVNDGSGVYTNTTEVAGSPGDTIYYKYWNNGDGTKDNWEGGNNTTFTVTTTPQRLSRYFNGLAGSIAVTFEVDMGYQFLLGNFNTDGSDHIELKSGLNQHPDWPGYELTNVPDTTLYANTVLITNTVPGSIIEYKFHIWGMHDIWESLGLYPNGNRRFTLASSAQTIPTAYFGDAWTSESGIEVFFQIDMSPQIGAGNYDPSSVDLIQAMGLFNSSWSGVVLNSDSARPGVYTNSYVETFRAPGTRMEYKYAINRGGAGNLQYESLVGYPDGNRAFMLTNVSPQALPVEYFSDASGLPIKAGIYFQLDMSSQAFVRAFDPLIDLVSVRGDALGWGDPPASSLQLFADAARPGIYTNTWLSASQLTGAAFPYKYAYVHSGKTIWEGGDNKSVSFTGTEPVNPVGYHMINLGPTPFDNWQVNTNDYLPADTYVTFSVSMTNAQSYPGFSDLPLVFDRMTMNVVLNGNWVPWWNWNAAAPADLIMTNGTSGDWIYSQTVRIPKGSPVQLVYKYGIDDLTGLTSLNNEAPDGSDRVRYIRQTGSYALPMDTFGVQTVELPLGSMTIGTPSGGKVPVTWLGLPGAHLQSSPDLNNPAAWVNHPETAAYGSPGGIYSTNYPMSGQAIFFRVKNAGSP